MDTSAIAAWKEGKKNEVSENRGGINHPPTDFSDMSKTEKYYEQNNNIT